MFDIVTGFFNRCSIHPSNTAVEHLGIKYSYHELSVLSKRVAKALNTSVGSNTKVFLAMTASPNSYTGMIGSLLNRGTFCPIDIDGPEERTIEIFNSFNSFGHLSIVLALEQEYGITIDDAAFKSFKTMREIYKSYEHIRRKKDTND